MGADRVKRKTYIVNRPMQYQLIGVFYLSVMISLVLFTAGSSVYYWMSGMSGGNLFKEYLTIHRQVTEVREVETDQGVVTEEVAATKIIPGVKRWEIVVPALIINNIIMLVVILILGIIYSHRIAGPIYHIQQDLERVLQGERGVRITLRRKDRFKALAEQLNRVLDELEASSETSIDKNNG